MKQGDAWAMVHSRQMSFGLVEILMERKWQSTGQEQRISEGKNEDNFRDKGRMKEEQLVVWHRSDLPKINRGISRTGSDDFDSYTLFTFKDSITGRGKLKQSHLRIVINV